MNLFAYFRLLSEIRQLKVNSHYLRRIYARYHFDKRNSPYKLNSYDRLTEEDILYSKKCLNDRDIDFLENAATKINYIFFALLELFLIFVLIVFLWVINRVETLLSLNAASVILSSVLFLFLCGVLFLLSLMTLLSIFDFSKFYIYNFKKVIKHSSLIKKTLDIQDRYKDG
jgi:hypothetical protein